MGDRNKPLLSFLEGKQNSISMMTAKSSALTAMQLSNDITQLKAQVANLPHVLESKFTLQQNEHMLFLEKKFAGLDALVENKIQESIAAHFDRALDYTQMRTVVLPRCSNGLGVEASMEYDHFGRASLCIEKVLSGGALADWNRANTSEALQPGDKIVGVNHIYGSAAQLREQLTNPFATDVVLAITRAGSPQLQHKLNSLLAPATSVGFDREIDGDQNHCQASIYRALLAPF